MNKFLIAAVLLCISFSANALVSIEEWQKGTPKQQSIYLQGFVSGLVTMNYIYEGRGHDPDFCWTTEEVKYISDSQNAATVIGEFLEETDIVVKDLSSFENLVIRSLLHKYPC